MTPHTTIMHKTPPLRALFRLACVLLLALSFWDCSGCCEETEFIPEETATSTTASKLEPGQCKATPDCNPDQVCRKGTCVAAKRKKKATPTPTNTQDPSKEAPKFTPEEEAAVGSECTKSTDCSGELVCGAKGCEKPPECVSDAQCPKGLSCDLSMRLCRKPICFQDNDCPGDGFCVYGKCETEAPGCRGRDCPPDHFCIPESGECEPKNCKSDDDCATGRYCGGKHCRECQQDSHCAPGQVCEKIDGICQEPETCTSDENCLATRVCNSSTGKCESGPCSEDRFTGNNKREKAHPLPEGSQELSLCTGVDDWFSVELNQGDAIRLHVSRKFVQHAGMEIRIYPPEGPGEISRWTDVFSSGNFTGILESAPEAGTYAIRLKHRWGEHIDYTLRADIIRGGSCINDTIEPNDTFATATKDNLNHPQVFRLCPGDQDWYVGTAKAGHLLEVYGEVLRTPIPGFAFYRALPNGRLDLIDSTAPGERRKMTFTVPEATGTRPDENPKEVEQTFYVRAFYEDPEEDNEYRIYFINRSTLQGELPPSDVPINMDNVENIKDLNPENTAKP